MRIYLKKSLNPPSNTVSIEKTEIKKTRFGSEQSRQKFLIESEKLLSQL